MDIEKLRLPKPQYTAAKAIYPHTPRRAQDSDVAIRVEGSRCRHFDMKTFSTVKTAAHLSDAYRAQCAVYVTVFPEVKAVYL